MGVIALRLPTTMSLQPLYSKAMISPEYGRSCPFRMSRPIYGRCLVEGLSESMYHLRKSLGIGLPHWTDGPWSAKTCVSFHPGARQKSCQFASAPVAMRTSLGVLSARARIILNFFEFFFPPEIQTKARAPAIDQCLDA